MGDILIHPLDSLMGGYNITEHWNAKYKAFRLIWQ